jgi:hypothetical protein
MLPEEIVSRAPFRRAICSSAPTHEVGDGVPKVQIDEVKKQNGRDLTRFDMDFDLPDQFMPEFPPPIYLTTRPDLGDVSQGKLVTIDNYFELFNGILNPKQLEGRASCHAVSAQFNATKQVRPGAWQLPDR